MAFTLRHCPGYRIVTVGRASFFFGSTQAQVVRLLHQALQDGTPAMHQRRLLESSGSECQCLAHLFRGNPAWGTLIVPGPVRGTYRLSIPPKRRPEKPEIKA
jgi:hypothetical protein